MRMEKHEKALKEVSDEIESALDDPLGLVNHQRRLALMLSLGVTELIEIYFHKLGVIKEGARIKHNWFRKDDIRERLSNQIVCPLDKIKRLDEIIAKAVDIEESRDDLAYGSPVDEEKLLREKIEQFLELKKTIENEVGVIETK